MDGMGLNSSLVYRSASTLGITVIGFIMVCVSFVYISDYGIWYLHRVGLALVLISVLNGSGCLLCVASRHQQHVLVLSGFVCSAFGSAWFCIIMSGYTSALQIADVFGCLVTRPLYRLQMYCRCVWLSGYTFALQIADVFGSALVCMYLFRLLWIETSSSTEATL
ncbi:hypothetical protein Tco_0702735 [Tanacetum coccineum]|uniref:Uncharacterized protein n=1 Tax=Tanacetum coccineum TaxID=301880 RepID=A0ABQ4XWU4_9ASTR